MQVVLVMFRSDGEQRSFSVTRDVTVIGRREDCDLRIPLGEVSRKHCRLIKDGDTLKLEDLGSSNGTYHNGQRVQEAQLQPGDHLQVGPVIFAVQIDGYPPEEELAPGAPVEAAPVALQELEEIAPTAPDQGEHYAAADLAALEPIEAVEEVEAVEAVEAEEAV